MTAPTTPYVGPRAFERGEPLFGRERELRDLLALLIAERIVLCYSPSGAGKTSLIQAALIPALEEEQFNVLPTIRLTQQPAADTSAAPNRYLYSTLASLDQSLTPDELSVLALPDYLQRAVLSTDPRELVLIFDQFEEVLTIDPTDVAAKQAFFEQLGAVLKERRVWALFAMREDHLAGLDPYLRPIPKRLQDRFRLDLLGTVGARAAVQGPARAQSVEFTDEAASALVDDLRRTRVQLPDGSTELALGPSVEPVQLQVVCLRLWRRLFGDEPRPPAPPAITRDLLGTVGDVNEALAEYYSEQIERVAVATGVSERTIRGWFERRLITREGRRSQVLLEEGSSAGLANLAIAGLLDAYLVRQEQRRGSIWYELAHDRLVDPIRSSNKAWRDLHLTTFQRQAELWDEQSRPDGLYLKGQALRDAEVWASANTLNEVEQVFLAQCQKEAREAQNLRWALTVAIVALVLTIVCAVIAGVQYLAAAAQERSARVRQLAAEALLDRGVNPAHSLLLAVDAARIAEQSPEAAPDAEESLRAALADAGGLPLRGHREPVRVVATSPDGKWIATAGDDTTVRLWRVASPEAAPLILRGHTEHILSLAFSPDSLHVAAGGEDGTVRVWRLDDLALAPLVLRDHILDVNALAFSPDGRTLASASADMTARLWPMDDPRRPVITLEGHTADLTCVAYSRDGALLVTGDSEGRVLLWHPGEPTSRVGELSGHEGSVVALDISPDGRLLLTGSDNGKVWLWGVAEPSAPLREFTGHKGVVTDVAFSPNGQWLVTAGSEGAALLRRVDKLDAEPLALSEHTGEVAAVAFSPDSQWLATAGADGTARLWNVSAPESAAIVLTGHSKPVKAVAFGQDSRILVTGSDDGTARLWRRTAPAAAPMPLRANASGIWAVAASPDSRYFAAGSNEGAVRLWRPDQPEAQAVELHGHELAVVALAFSPDGRWLATGSWDRTARLWSIGALPGGPAVQIEQIDHPGSVRAVAFSADSSILATGTDDNIVRLWSAKDGWQTPMQLGSDDAVGGSNGVTALAFSPDGRWLAAGYNSGILQLWPLDQPGAAPLSLPKHDAAVLALAFSPNGHWLATGSQDHTARIYTVATFGQNSIAGQVISGEHSEAVRAVTFSTDSQRLITAGADKTTRIWEVANLSFRPVVLREQTSEIRGAAITPDGKWLAIGGSGATLWLWPMQLDELKARACRAAGQNLSLAEWHQRYGQNATYIKLCPKLPWPEDSYVQLVQAGDINTALARYEEDRRLDPTLDPPSGWLVRQALAMMYAKQSETALALYARAEKEDPSMAGVDPRAVYLLCRAGALAGETAVRGACDWAVKLDDENGNFRYYRGLVLRGLGEREREQAIEDFKRFIAWAPGRRGTEVTIPEVEGWIQELEQAR
ncbi:MAG: hypothetical protein HGA45_17780 [Chloroflexales bacterium]|nr:hypothetical protein [Chloroflexales bacterium]